MFDPTQALTGEEYPFDQITAEVAERRYNAAMKLVEAFADLFAVVLVETNEVGDGRKNYQGETPVIDMMTRAVTPLVLVLANALIQREIAAAQPKNAVEGFNILIEHVDATPEKAHAILKDTIETRCGSTMSELIERVLRSQTVKQSALASLGLSRSPAKA